MNNYIEVKFIIEIGDNTIRGKIDNLVVENKRDIHTLISKSASFSTISSIGIGTFVNKNVSTNAFVKIGNNLTLSTACVIEYDCTLGDSLDTAPGAKLAGNASIKNRSFICTNAQL